jgi:hypothetical protein
VRWAAVILVIVAACTSHVDGTITLDGAPFKVTECRSGAVHNFSGIQLADEHSTQLRILQNVDGTIAVAVFPNNALKGDTIGTDCGTIRIESQSSRINNIRNVEGAVKLSCTGAGHTIEGSLNFENCH